ncbi:FxsA family protein [Bacillus sp. Marseille-P3661]|uniref:FxsA family protein n=1 Tax=Bacillus sp. Marseille-P3661 TaxID=1936234 RepID=UPI000C865A12|nr:FxsA family protein [Bacillus sp. Marseille-P3661]
MRIIVLLLIIIPAAEIGLLLLSGNTFGVWPTITIIILTGLIGGYLAKSQGIKAINAAQYQMSTGQIPGDAILDGLCILVGGLLLLTPGFITDATGFLLLSNRFRYYIRGWLKRWLEHKIRNGQFHIIRR